MVGLILGPLSSTNKKPQGEVVNRFKTHIHTPVGNDSLIGKKTLSSPLCLPAHFSSAPAVRSLIRILTSFSLPSQFGRVRLSLCSLSFLCSRPNSTNQQNLNHEVTLLIKSCSQFNTFFFSVFFSSNLLSLPPNLTNR